MQEFVKINSKDNVAVALKDLEKGSKVTVEDHELTLLEDIPRGHKFTLNNLKTGDNVIKYGFPIGHVTKEVHVGSWVHTQNIKTNLGDVLSYSYEPDITPLSNREKVTFNGFRRKNGKVGIRNEIWIIPTVGCVNNIASMMEKKFASKIMGTIDSIVAFPHPYGCSQMGDDQENTRIILADLINHPNAGGVLVLGLGCENSNIIELKRYIGEYDEDRVRFLQCQDVEDEITAAEGIIDDLISYASGFQRESIGVDELVIGMKCGGSDGMSGITANPTVGTFSDILVSQGGTTVLTEVPEMFGAETLLMARCQTEEVFEKTVSLINDFKNYFTSYNQTIYENPSPGNKQGGISTLEDKSLGCTQKSGTAPISDVLKYGEVVKNKGLNLLSAPGNDLVASTALAASGCHMVLFTTGRGTPFASPVPTMKISTNTPLATKKSKWIDFNTGTLVEGKTLDILGEELFQYVIAIANGEKVKAEEAGFHDMAIFKQGVTL